MADIKFNSHYLGSDRGIVKIIQIILGFVLCSVLCANWYGGASCFGEGRIGYVSGLNFVVLIINIVLFLMNLCNIRLGRLEYIYNVIASIMFVVSIVLLVWYMIERGDWQVWRIVTLVATIVILLLFSWDSNRARHHEDHLPI